MLKRNNSIIRVMIISLKSTYLGAPKTCLLVMFWNDTSVNEAFVISVRLIMSLQYNGFKHIVCSCCHIAIEMTTLFDLHMHNFELINFSKTIIMPLPE